MNKPDLRQILLSALAKRGDSSSDFDLNPGIRLPEGRTPRQAAVLVAFNESDGSLILTKRSAHLKHHPGQIAFPGGRRDDTDADLEATALREAHEEIGLVPSNVEVLGCLPTHETVSNYIATPVVALVKEPFVFEPEAGEVEEAFTVPFEHVTNPSNFRVEGRRWQGQKRFYFTVPYGPYYIWGATALILRRFAERLDQ